MIDFDRALEEMAGRISVTTDDARHLQQRITQAFSKYGFPEGNYLEQLARAYKRLELYRRAEALLRNAKAGNCEPGTSVADVLRKAAGEALEAALADTDAGTAFRRARREAERAAAERVYRSLLEDAELVGKL